MTLIKGYIGQVELKVSGGSWTNIMSKPIEVWFDHIHLLLGPKFDWDEEDRATREQQIQALLRRAELFAMHGSSQGQSVDGTNPAAQDHRGGDSFIERLMTKLVDNVEFHVRDVHIRYEDHLSNPANPFALGLMLSKKIHLKSTNEHYQEVYVNRAGDKRGPAWHFQTHCPASTKCILQSYLR